MSELDVLPALLPRTSVALGSWCDSWRVVRMGLSDPYLTILFPDVSCACNRGPICHCCTLPPVLPSSHGTPSPQRLSSAGGGFMIFPKDCELELHF